jgi:CelD/BcsL family acetyltransferase involved in cellulose biosynthesis
MVAMRAELVKGADVEATLDDWSVLYAADPTATPFISAGWARAWIQHWATRTEPWVLRIHDGARVAGIAPLSLQRVGPLRVLGMLGKEPGDYWYVLAAPPDSAPVSAAVAHELVRRRSEWDAGILNCVVPGSQTQVALAAAGLRIMPRPDVPCPAIALPSTWDEYLATLPHGRRGKLRRLMRRLSEGQVVLREVRDANELPNTLMRWQELRQRQWDARGRPLNPVHRTEQFRRFLLHAVTALIPAGQALVWEFSVEGDIAGIYVNFMDARSFYWYLGGFDPAHASLGIGTLAIAASIRQSIERERERYDFTRGSEEYKYWFGANDRLAASIVVGNSRLRSRGALAGARVVNVQRQRAAAANRDSAGGRRGSELLRRHA